MTATAVQHIDTRLLEEPFRNTPDIWSGLDIDGHNLILKYQDCSIVLASINKEDLPAPPTDLTASGRFYSRMSVMANLMLAAPGSEEMGFYALIDKPNPRLGIRYVDRKILNMAAPAVQWRRERLTRYLHTIMKEAIQEGHRNLRFLDLGSGCGLDGLEFGRLASQLTEVGIPTETGVVNIDTEKKWLDLNQQIRDTVVTQQSPTLNRHMSIYDYLERKLYKEDLAGADYVCVACNGILDFLDDRDADRLLELIRELFDHFKGRIALCLPFMMQNPEQERMIEKTGVRIKARERKKIIRLVEQHFYTMFRLIEEHPTQLLVTIRSKNISPPTRL